MSLALSPGFFNAMATVKMTEGSPFRLQLAYSFSLVLGNIFQLAYNAADSIIVGRFIGKEALAAVGTASPVMNIVILSISGITIGASVLMSGYYGGGKEDLLKKEMATLSVFGLFFSVSIAIIGALLCNPLVRLIQVPKEIRPITVRYLSIIFLGTPFTYFYNSLSASLKSVGDSKTPLKFLVFSSVLNVALDLVFIGILGFGITCSATTTVVAEAVSAILCILYIYKRVPVLSLPIREFRIDGSLLKKTLNYGSITALQQSIQPICKLLIQGAVNTLGVDVIAAYNAVTRIDDFAFTPEQSIASGITTFVAQNDGAGRKERIVKGFRAGLLIEILYWIFICLFSYLLRFRIMALFIAQKDSAMIAIGAKYLALMSVLYILPAMTNGLQGFMRGIRKMKITLICTAIQASMRVVFVYILIPYLGILSVAVASSIGWILMLLVEVPLYFHYKKKDLVA